MGTEVALGCASVGAQCACFLSEVFLVKNQFPSKRHLSAGRLSPNDSVDFIIIYEKIDQPLSLDFIPRACGIRYIIPTCSWSAW